MATLLDDIKYFADKIAAALNSSGYKANFSLESLREIDRFFDDQTQDGDVRPDGLLADQFGQRMFALGSYVGEVIRIAYGGEWRCDENDPDAEINVVLGLPDGSIIWPMQRVMKRFKNGPEDGIYVYGIAVGSPLRSGKQPSQIRPWWKFW